MMKEIHAGGMTTTPSDCSCRDGELSLSLNMLYEDGDLHPIAEPGAVCSKTESGGQWLIHTHSTTGGTHYIRYTESEKGTDIYWSEKINEAGTSEQLIMTIAEWKEITGVRSLGNTLVIQTNDGLNYALWKDDLGGYIHLGTHLPETSISFGLQAHATFFSKESYMTDDGSENGRFEVAIPDMESREDTTFSSSQAEAVTDSVLPKVNRFINEVSNLRGRFLYPFMVRWAYRMFDGSHTMHSAPILMFPSTTAVPLVEGKYKSMSDGKMKIECDLFAMPCTLDYRITSMEDGFAETWGDIITGIDIFVSPPLYTYKQSGECEGISFGDLYNHEWNSDKPECMLARLAECNYYGCSTEEERESLNTSATFSSHYQWWNYRDAEAFMLVAHHRHTEGDSDASPFEHIDTSITLPSYSEGEMRSKIETCSNFHLLYSLSMDDLSTHPVGIDSERTAITVDDSWLGSLTSKESLIDDYHSHETLSVRCSYVYNSRLHLGGITRQLFKGFDMSDMVAYQDGGSTYMKDWTDISAAFTESDIISRYHFVSWTHNSGAGTNHLCWDSSEVPLAIDFSCEQAPCGQWRSRPLWLFQPTEGCSEAIIKSVVANDDNTSSYHQYKANEHTMLNGSFVFTGLFGSETETAGVTSYPTASTLPTIEAMNKIYTSEVYNAFSFPLSGISTAGSGDVLSLSSAVKTMSEGQFGQHPMYVFTSEGVWAMSVDSSTGYFISSHPVTFEQGIVGGSVTGLEASVVYISNRGVMQITGSSVRCLSSLMNGKIADTELYPHLQQIIRNITGSKSEYPSGIYMKDYLSSDCRICHDATRRQLLLINPSMKYSFVMSLSDKTWGVLLLKKNISHIFTDSNDTYIVNSDGSVSSLLQRSAQSTTFVCMTRPLRLYDVQIRYKKVNGLEINGYGGSVNANHWLQTALYGSNDLRHWFLIGSSTSKRITGLMGSGYRYHTIVIGSKRTEMEAFVEGCNISV